MSIVTSTVNCWPGVALPGHDSVAWAASLREAKATSAVASSKTIEVLR